MSAAVIVGQHRSVDIEQAALTGNARRIDGDRATCEALIRNVAQFILDGPLAPDEQQPRLMLRSLTRAPLTREEVKLGLDLIDQHPLVHVVPNEANLDTKVNLVLITREMTMGVNDHRMVAMVGEDRLRAIRSTQRAEIKLIGVSAMSHEAAKRHYEVLCLQQVQVVYVQQAARPAARAPVAAEERPRQGCLSPRARRYLIIAGCVVFAMAIIGSLSGNSNSDE